MWKSRFIAYFVARLNHFFHHSTRSDLWRSKTSLEGPGRLVDIHGPSTWWSHPQWEAILCCKGRCLDWPKQFRAQSYNIDNTMLIIRTYTHTVHIYSFVRSEYNEYVHLRYEFVFATKRANWPWRGPASWMCSVTWIQDRKENNRIPEHTRTTYSGMVIVLVGRRHPASLESQPQLVLYVLRRARQMRHLWGS